MANSTTRINQAIQKHSGHHVVLEKIDGTYYLQPAADAPEETHNVIADLADRCLYVTTLNGQPLQHWCNVVADMLANETATAEPQPVETPEQKQKRLNRERQARYRDKHQKENKIEFRQFVSPDEHKALTALLSELRSQP